MNAGHSLNPGQLSHIHQSLFLKLVHSQLWSRNTQQMMTDISSKQLGRFYWPEITMGTGLSVDFCKWASVTYILNAAWGKEYIQHRHLLKRSRTGRTSDRSSLSYRLRWCRLLFDFFLHYLIILVHLCPISISESPMPSNWLTEVARNSPQALTLLADAYVYTVRTYL